MLLLPLPHKTPVIDSRNAYLPESSIQLQRRRAHIPFLMSHLEVNT